MPSTGSESPPEKVVREAVQQAIDEVPDKVFEHVRRMSEDKGS